MPHLMEYGVAERLPCPGGFPAEVDDAGRVGGNPRDFGVWLVAEPDPVLAGVVPDGPGDQERPVRFPSCVGCCRPERQGDEQQRGQSIHVEHRNGLECLMQELLVRP